MAMLCVQLTDHQVKQDPASVLPTANDCRNTRTGSITNTELQKVIKSQRPMYPRRCSLGITVIMPRVPQNASFSVPHHASRVMRFGLRASKAVVTAAGVGALGGLGGWVIAGVLQVPICDCSALPSLRA